MRSWLSVWPVIVISAEPGEPTARPQKARSRQTSRRRRASRTTTPQKKRKRKKKTTPNRNPSAAPPPKPTPRGTSEDIEGKEGKRRRAQSRQAKTREEVDQGRIRPKRRSARSVPRRSMGSRTSRKTRARPESETTTLPSVLPGAGNGGGVGTGGLGLRWQKARHGRCASKGRSHAIFAGRR